MVLEWTMNAAFYPDVRRKPSCVAAKRTSDSGIFVGVSWSVQGRQNFHGAEHRFRWGLSGVTNLIGGKAGGGTRVDGRRCLKWRMEL